MNAINKRNAYIGCLGMVSIISTEFGVIGILPQIAKHYSINIETAGYLLSAFALTIAFTGPFMVLYTSKFDRKKVMLVGIAMFFVSNLLSVFAPPFWLLMVIRVLPAFLQPVFISTAIAVAIKDVPETTQHRLMSIVIGGIALAQVTVIPFVTFMAARYGFQISFVIQGMISLLAVTAIYFIMPSMPVAEPKSFGSQLNILKRKTFIISTMMNVFLIAAWFSTYSYFADYLSKVKGLTGEQISYMLLLFGIMGVISNFVAGRILGENLVKTTVLFLLGTLILPLVLSCTGASMLSVSLVVAFWGTMYGPCFLTAVAYMVSCAPEAKEFANSLQTSFGNLGVSAGTAISGWFIAKYSIGIAPWVGFLFGVFAILCIVWRSMEELRQKKKLQKKSHLSF
ncbi:Predicted arabinose efflux permease, MFS family [Pedobacter westerhofensis]|uniref:Predicted arabinose efflux permease, MFS family n=1 Tax=Pedobacter westerhofensis TaxID=425512 RepID=A0A521FMN2_9SPHI|nr:MFS transporter [Pedobacter westerhofensis]SMO96721.1 Predicted arabinose efflux permease, MFS family [Pedobacter westerhofensis]